MTIGRTRLFAVAIAVGAVVAVIAGGSAAVAGDDSFGANFAVHERLNSFQETPAALSTGGSGQFRLLIDDERQQITYQLSYAGLEGTVQQSHIHLGGRAQSGGVIVFLCSNLGNGPAGTQACPAAPGTISGTITAADIIGPAGQGIAAGEFAEVLRAIRAGATYVNVHSTLFPGGEIRAQIGRGH